MLRRFAQAVLLPVALAASVLVVTPAASAASSGDPVIYYKGSSRYPSRVHLAFPDGTVFKIPTNGWKNKVLYGLKMRDGNTAVIGLGMRDTQSRNCSRVSIWYFDDPGVGSADVATRNLCWPASSTRVR